MSRTGLTWFRSRRRTLSQGVLALFCLVWLQAALLPCAMAAMPGGMSSAAEEHCPYCPPESAHSTTPDQGPGACSYPDGPQVDTRGTLSTAVAPPVAPLQILLEPSHATVDVAAPDDPGTSLPRRSFAVSYCRFLK